MHPQWLCFAFIFFSSFALGQDTLAIENYTEGLRSPSIVSAGDVAVGYGVHPNIVTKLLQTYEQQGLSPEEQLARAEALLEKYKALPTAETSDRQLSARALRELGIQQDSTLSTIMQWLVFTEGANSPAIISAGNVDIWYGISESAFRNIYEIFFEKQGEYLFNAGKLELFERQLADQIQKYNKLRGELKLREDELAQRATQLLDAGKIDEAELVLRQRYLLEKKQDQTEQLETAAAGFAYAQTLELDTAYAEATDVYRDIVQLAPDNALYIYALTLNLLSRAHYQEAIDRLQGFIDSEVAQFAGARFERIATYCNNMGLAYALQGNFTQAEACFEQAARFNTALFGASSLHVALNLNNLGSIFAARGSIERAISFFGQAREIATLLLPHFQSGDNAFELHLIAAFNGHRIIFYQTGLLRHSHQLNRNDLPFDEASRTQIIHVTCLNNLGAARQLLGDCPQAVPLLEQGIVFGRQLQQDFDQTIQYLPDSLRAHPNFSRWIQRNSQAAVLDQLRFQKANCLQQMGQQQPAKELFDALLHEAQRRGDGALILDLKSAGVAIDPPRRW